MYSIHLRLVRSLFAVLVVVLVVGGVATYSIIAMLLERDQRERDLSRLRDRSPSKKSRRALLSEDEEDVRPIEEDGHHLLDRLRWSPLRGLSGASRAREHHSMIRMPGSKESITGITGLSFVDAS